jgi:hypothetical protein
MNVSRDYFADSYPIKSVEFYGHLIDKPPQIEKVEKLEIEVEPDKKPLSKK